MKRSDKIYLNSESMQRMRNSTSAFSISSNKLIPDENKFNRDNRSNTSVLKYRLKKTESMTPSFCVFGKDAPKIAIGMSRPEEKVNINYPGPGEYDVPTFLDTPGLGIRIPRCEKYCMPENLTANIDFTNPRIFPEIRKKSISNTERQPFHGMPQSPGPNFLPPSTLDKHAHLICSGSYTQKSTSDDTPGPGTYEPNKVSLESSPLYSFSGPSRRDDWIFALDKTPGPGRYENNKLKLTKSVPVWTFGEKSRKRNNKPVKHLVIHPFIVKIDNGVDFHLASKYLDKHKIKDFINEIYENVIRDKPENPLLYIAEKYWNEKVEYDLKHPKEEDPFDVYKLI